MWLGGLRLAMFILAFVAVCCVGVVQGFQGLLEAQKFHKPEELTHQQFIKRRPHEGWFRIRNARLMVLGAVYEMKVRKGESTGPVTGVCAPLVPEDDPIQKEKHFVFVESEAPEIIAAASTLLTPDDQRVDTLLQDIRQRREEANEALERARQLEETTTALQRQAERDRADALRAQWHLPVLRQLEQRQLQPNHRQHGSDTSDRRGGRHRQCLRDGLDPVKRLPNDRRGIRYDL